MSGWPVPRRVAQWRGVLRPGRFLIPRGIAWGIALFALVAGGSGLAQRLTAALGISRFGPPSLLRLAITLAAALGIYALAVRYGERRPVSELAPRRLVPELAAGLVFGGVMFAVVMALLVGGGWYTMSVDPAGPPWRAIGIGLGAGTIEELLFRGILMRLLWEAFGLEIALAVSASLFGLAHLLNPQHSAMGAISIIIEAGVMLGALFALTGRLWASIGAHAAWNFTQGYVFGTDVSGVDAGGHWLHAVQVSGAPVLLTGGEFGPEASLAGVLVGASAGALVLLWTWRRNAVLPVAGAVR